MKQTWDTGRRNGHDSGALDHDPMGGTSEDRDLGDIEPGDAIDFWGEGHRIVS